MGAFLLNKEGKKKEEGKNSDELDNLQFIFGFTCEGIHPHPRRQKDFFRFGKNITLNAKEIPFGEYFNTRWSSFSDSSDTEKHLSERIERLKATGSLESEFLDWSLLGKTQKLTADKAHNKISLTIYTTYTVSTKADDKDVVDRLIVKLGNKLDNLLEKLGGFWRQRFTQDNAEYKKKQLNRILSRAQEAAQRHHQTLFKMGLNPISQTEKELYRDLCTRLGSQNCDPSHVLVFDQYGVREEFGDGAGLQYQNPLIQALKQVDHATTAAINSSPFADHRWVCLRMPDRKNKYIGVLTLDRKPEGFAGEEGQLRFVWDVLSYSHDVEIITQASPADVGLTRSAQQMITRQNRTLDLNVQARKSVEVSAQINTDRSVAAQRRMYTGDIPFNAAVVILVYRNSPEELDSACSQICGLFSPAAKFVREYEYTWLIWLQTLGVRHEYLLAHPFNRRHTFFASELSGVSCFIKPKEFDRKGFTLITDQGRCPIKIDFSKPQHTLICGDTGAGKSLFVAGIANECIAQGMAFLLIDLPNADGTGTFRDWTLFFNGFYYDIARESNNLAEHPALENMSEEERAEAMSAFKTDVDFIIQHLVLGSTSKDDFLTQTVESLIPLGTKAFYEDPEIQSRFAAGKAAPIGSPDHQNTPTLVDLQQFYTTKHIKWQAWSEEVEKALSFIQLRLRYWQTSPIGDAICKPSSFRTSNKKLITFALTDLKNPKHAEVFGMSAYLAATRQQLESPGVLAMDEASVLLKYDGLSLLMGRRTAIGRKARSTSIVIGQQIDSIATSAGGPDIIYNMKVRHIGRIAPGAAESFAKTLNIPLEIVEKNESFKPNTQKMYTLWLTDYGNTYTLSRYYPSRSNLALTVNDELERKAREEFKNVTQVANLNGFLNLVNISLTVFSKVNHCKLVPSRLDHTLEVL